MKPKHLLTPWLCLFLFFVAVDSHHKQKSNEQQAVKNKLLRKAAHNMQWESLILLRENMNLKMFDFYSVMMVLIERCAAHRVPVNRALALIGIESGFDPSAISVTNDYGLFQINKTYWEFDMDKILVPAYNIDLGLKILRYYYDRAGNWPLAMAMYNMGKNHRFSKHPEKLLKSKFMVPR